MREDDFKIGPDDGYRYSMPERERDRKDREAGYIILGLVVALVMIATATGKIMIFAQY